MHRHQSLKQNNIYYPQENDVNSSQKPQIIGAIMIEEIISSILATKFISCWSTLKQYGKLNNSSRKIFINYDMQLQHLRPTSQYILKKSRRKSMKSSHSRQRIFERTKSVDSKLQLSRAEILNKIAIKLKDSKNSINSNTHSRKNDNTLLKKIAKVQKMLKTMQKNKQQTNQKLIRQQTLSTKNIHQDRMIHEILSLRNQINKLKQFNQGIQRRQVYLAAEKYRQQVLSANNIIQNQQRKLQSPQPQPQPHPKQPQPQQYNNTSFSNNLVNPNIKFVPLHFIGSSQSNVRPMTARIPSYPQINNVYTYVNSSYATNKQQRYCSQCHRNCNCPPIIK